MYTYNYLSLSVIRKRILELAIKCWNFTGRYSLTDKQVHRYLALRCKIVFVTLSRAALIDENLSASSSVHFRLPRRTKVPGKSDAKTSLCLSKEF